MQIGFHPQKSSHLNPYVGWTALLCAAMLGALPMMLLAAEPLRPSPTPQQQPSTLLNPETRSCLMSCGNQAKICVTAAGDNKDAHAQCETATRACLSTCSALVRSGSSTLPTGGIRGDHPSAQTQPKHEDPSDQHISDFSKQLTRVEARIVALKKNGVTIPDELSAALTAAESDIAQLKDAEDGSDTSGIQEDLRGQADIIKEWMPQLERLANLKSIYARIDRQIRTLDTQLKQDQVLAKYSKVDLSGEVGAFSTSLTSLKDAYASAKAIIVAGDPEAGFDALQNDVFEAIPDVTEHHTVIRQMVRISTTISQAGRDISSTQSKLTRFAKAGKETAAAQATLDQLKAKLEVLKTEAKASPIDTDAISGTLQEMQDLHQQLMDAMNAIQGTETTNPVDQGIKAPSFDLNLGM